VLENVALGGPQEEISLIGVVSTESLSLAEANASAQSRLRVVPPAGKKFQVEPESVTVALKIEKEESRLFPEVAVSLFKPGQFIVSLRPATAHITVSGPAEQVKSLTLQEIAASIKVADTMVKGRHRLPCEITLPPGIALVKCDPALFEVEIK
jgi:YbbR domain-containing protein